MRPRARFSVRPATRPIRSDIPRLQHEGEVQLCADPWHGDLISGPPPEGAIAVPACATHGVPLDDEGDCPTCMAERRKDHEEREAKRAAREEENDRKYIERLRDRARTIYKALRHDEKAPGGGYGAEIATALTCALIVAERLDEIEARLSQIQYCIDKLDR